MKSNKYEDSVLNKITADIRDESIDDAAVKAAADRVWARVSAAAGEAKLETTAVDRIEGCADFQSLIPAYLNGQLSEARSLLLVDHTHECIPCRRSMNRVRSQRVAVVREPAKRARYNVRPVVMRWGIAAALIIGFGFLAVPLIQHYLPGGSFEATVQAADGPVFQIADTRSRPITSGAKLQRGDVVRTAKDAHAIVRLGDGSTIEMKDRTELSLAKTAQGTTIHLGRGSVVVEAAKQKGEHLYIDTGDSLVSVTGTVFSVNSGTKGSRVSVIEGEVHLDHAGSQRVLLPGEQATTNASIEAVPVKDEVSWSKNAGRYAQILALLKTDLAKVPQPGVRNSTHLLNLMPENTVVYAALPNLTSTMAESHRLIQERIGENPVLRQWWEKERAGKGQNMDQVIETIREFGDYLGDEIAVSVCIDDKGEPVAPLVLAELKNAQGFRAFFEQQIAKYTDTGTRKSDIRFVEDPSSATPTDDSRNHVLYVWIRNDLFAASPKLLQLQDLAAAISTGSSSFTASPFYDRIAEVYRDGAGLVVAANLEKVIAQTQNDRMKGPEGEKNESALKQLGILNVKYFVLDQDQENGKTHTRAALSFNDPQRGIPSWLATPGAMGSLEYISPDANVVAGFVVKDPVRLVDDLLGVVETVSPD
ncbi:MAG: FecR domain-containing protein, partial [Pyrinomonadaceae bacterium]